MPRLLWPCLRSMTDQGLAFVGDLDGVSVPQLMRDEASSHAGHDRRAAKVRRRGLRAACRRD
jgi:hypothetical protein